jgi:putative Mg2+ transporter-C (MgtC) family protein
MDPWESVTRIAVAALLGGIIGLDRELRGHAAGLRTNILVAAAAALFADVSTNGFAELRGYDPSRVAADVVSGIGFLGAGAIFALGGRPRGLTTAAALWASAAVGLSAGLGRWQQAAGLVAVTLVALVVLQAAGDRAMRRRTQVRDLYLVVPAAPLVSLVQEHLLAHRVQIRQLQMTELGDHIGVDVVVSGREDQLDVALRTVGRVPGVAFASDELGGTTDG